jgi:hypothetical protein
VVEVVVEGNFLQVEIEEQTTRRKSGATRFGYFGHFKVAFPGPASGIKKIWMDGKVAHEWGGVSVPSLKSIAGTPAVAAFEGLPLEDFGNRIPALTALVRAEPVPPGARVVRRKRVGNIEEVAGWSR